MKSVRDSGGGGGGDRTNGGAAYDSCGGERSRARTRKAPRRRTSITKQVTRSRTDLIPVRVDQLRPTGSKFDLISAPGRS